MSIAAAEPPFSNIARQANKLMDQMQKGFYTYSTETWTPNVNLYETAGTYLVCVDLAGVDKQKIDVEVADQRLRLRGTRAVPDYDTSHAQPEGGAAEGGAPEAAAAEAAAAPPAEGKPAGDTQPRRVRIHLMEIDHGPFSREVELPSDADKQRITATYRSGLLWIEIPKV